MRRYLIALLIFACACGNPDPARPQTKKFGTDSLRVNHQMRIGLTLSNVSAQMIVNNTGAFVTGSSNPSLISIAAVAGQYTAISSGREGTGTMLPMTFWTNGLESARIDTSRQFLVGLSSSDVPPVAGTFYAKNLIAATATTNASAIQLSPDALGTAVLISGHSGSGSDNPFGIVIGSDLVAYWNAGKNFGVGGQSSFGTDAAGVIAIANGTAPTSSPANAVQIYSKDVAGSAEFCVRDEAGNETILSDVQAGGGLSGYASLNSDSLAWAGNNYLQLPASAWLPTLTNGAGDTIVSYMPCRNFRATVDDTMSVDFDTPRTTSVVDSLIVYGAVNQATGDSIGIDAQIRSTATHGVAVNSSAFGAAVEVIRDMGTTANVPARFAIALAANGGRHTIRLWRNSSITNDQSGKVYVITAWIKGKGLR